MQWQINMLPLDVLRIIALDSIPAYRAMLAIPQFARHTLQYNEQFQKHFVVKSRIHEGHNTYVLTTTLNYVLHSINNKPALEQYYNGRLVLKEWYRHGLKHRDNDEPAVVSTDTSKVWYQNGVVHRDGDKPAMIEHNNGRSWYKYGKLHRDHDLPAYDYAYIKKWYRDGKLHRQHGPAIDYDNNSPSEYWINGIRIYKPVKKVVPAYFS